MTGLEKAVGTGFRNVDQLREVDEDWWLDDPDWWFDDPCMELLVEADPLFWDPAGPRAKTAVEAKVRLSTVTRRSGFKERRTAGSPLGILFGLLVR